MADKVFDKAFNRALAGQRAAELRAGAQRPPSQEELEARQVERLRAADTPMSVSDAIQRILLAEKDKDYFRLLELPQPEVDALGRPAWACSGADISRAYRRLSALVHPDKNPSADARAAFEALNRAHRLLKDPSKLEESLNSHLAAAKRRQEAAEAAASPDERAVLFAAKRSQAEALRKQEADKYKAEVLQQRQRLQERAKRKREGQERAQRREAAGGSGSESEGEAGAGREEPRPATARERLAAAKRRAKPKLIF